METAIAKDIQSTITTAKNDQIDFIGLSRALHSEHKDEWHQIYPKWNEIFKTAEVNIAVKVDMCWGKFWDSCLQYIFLFDGFCSFS